jgi:uncharacterized membrane-anchored protein
MHFSNRSLNALRLFVPMLVCLILGVGGTGFAQSGQEERDNPVFKAFKETNWTRGPGTARLENIAEIQLPEHYVAAGGNDTRRIMEAMQNPPTGREVGVIFPESLAWFVVFEFDDIGYVKDDEKASLDTNAMLESIKHGTEAGNKERAKRGWPPLTIVGWEQPPRYDEQTHNLTWAVRAESRGEAVVNYNTRLLGRKGVMRVTLVTDPPKLPTVLPEFRTLLNGYTFAKGSRYAEWVPGDKVAKVGLTALVTGGAAAVAVKSGLAKYLWKILVIAGAGSLAFLRKVFRRNTA